MFGLDVSSCAGSKPVSEGTAPAFVIALVSRTILLRLCAGLVICTVVVSPSWRKGCALASVVLFTLAHTPHTWPTYFISLAPLVWIWRQNAVPLSLTRCVLEAAAVGFAMCWLITGYVESAVPTWGAILHASGCLLFSMQIVGIALAAHWSRNVSLMLAAPLITAAAITGELAQAWLGLTWATTNPSLAIATTPAAQWSSLLTPFGISAALYLCNFVMIPGAKGNWAMRFRGPATGFAVLSCLWFGGMVIESQVVVQPLSFTAMLVQPHVEFKKDRPWEPWNVLDPLTTKSLATSGPVDLIVWPETCLTESWREMDSTTPVESSSTEHRYHMSLQDLHDVRR